MNEEEKRRAVFLALVELFTKLNVSLCEFDKLLREGMRRLVEATLEL